MFFLFQHPSASGISLKVPDHCLRTLAKWLMHLGPVSLDIQKGWNGSDPPPPSPSNSHGDNPGGDWNPEVRGGYSRSQDMA